MLHESPQQAELAAGQGDRLTLGRRQLAHDQGQLPSGEGQNRPGRIAPAALAPTAQHRPHAGQKFARIARLGQIVVRAQLQPDDPVRLLAHGAQHHDGRTFARQAARDRQAVLARHHQVQHDQVGPLRRHRPVHLGGRSRPARAIAVLGQVIAQDFADAGVVIDHQDAGVFFGLHAVLCREDLSPSFPRRNIGRRR